MGIHMHCQDNHAAVGSVDFGTESKKSTNLKVTRSVLQFQEWKPGT